MRQFLPSRSMLEAFESSARTGSFTAAGRELNLTQGAVSKQVIALEAHLGLQLFDRLPNGTVLTDSGRAYSEEVRRALDLIHDATLRIMTNPNGGTLNLAVLPTFGSRWLIPRLPEFLEENHGITVNFVNRPEPFDFKTNDVHAAIHYGAPVWPRATCTYLMGEVMLPISSPGFLTNHDVHSPEELATAPLLSIASRPKAWEGWFRQNGVQGSISPGMVVGDFLTMIHAAQIGMGAALLPRFLVEKELEKGDLIVINDRPFTSEHGYHLVVPDDKLNFRPTLTFKAWLLANTQNFSG